MWHVEYESPKSVAFKPKQDNVDKEIRTKFRIVPIHRIKELWETEDEKCFMSLYDDNGTVEIVELDHGNFFNVAGALGWDLSPGGKK